ncbi:uncharacterized protein MONBRDRAFT_8402 [Monosiga brevicollis MX1]|uniref:non-specific serine/threonine protein kinase n=1 Tax=Monosiga brevicollis TaxID=81824 RepID=A9UZY3_MONBE|nr:uncharacterized protein MONBRDRAFT_8402 [Monosiga brevicollis MX1]EDQ89057.1 predicted protein [Monosiga brevicollis MX1]|eukprot:XP_001746162.1 hypothetical protein [Monosiga brevicollis MX1]
MTRLTAAFHIMIDQILEEDKERAKEEEIRRYVAALPSRSNSGNGGRSPLLLSTSTGTRGGSPPSGLASPGRPRRISTLGHHVVTDRRTIDGALVSQASSQRLLTSPSNSRERLSASVGSPAGSPSTAPHSMPRPRSNGSVATMEAPAWSPPATAVSLPATPLHAPRRATAMRASTGDLSETNPEAIERLRQIRRHQRRSSRSSMQFVNGSDNPLEELETSPRARRLSCTKVTVLNSTAETIPVHDVPDFMMRRSSDAARARRQSRASQVSVGSTPARRDSDTSRLSQTSSNTNNRLSNDSNVELEEASRVVTPTTISEVFADPEPEALAIKIDDAETQPDQSQPPQWLEQTVNPHQPTRRSTPPSATGLASRMGPHVAHLTATVSSGSGSAEHLAPGDDALPSPFSREGSGRRRAKSVTTATIRQSAASRVVDVKALDLATEATSSSSFGAATTSSLPYDRVMAELQRALRRNGVDFELDRNTLTCRTRNSDGSGDRRRRGSYFSEAEEDVSWEMAVQKISRLGLHGIRLRRLQGDHWRYKRLVDHVLQDARL